MLDSRRGTSASESSRYLGSASDQTVWLMRHKIRFVLQARRFRESIGLIEVHTSRSNAEIVTTALRAC
jgi:hypothetical protein